MTPHESREEPSLDEGERALRVCLALPTFYPVFGGGSMRFLRYQPGLRARGVESFVLAGTPRAKDAMMVEDEVEWDRPHGEFLPVADVEGIPVHRVSLPRETGRRRTRAYFRALETLCRSPETRPDVIQLHSFQRPEALSCLRRLRRLGIPIVYAVQIATKGADRNALSRVFLSRFQRAFFSSYDGVVTSSEAIYESLVALGVESELKVIPNGVDLAKFAPVHDASVLRAVRARLGCDDTGPIVVSVGAVSARKGSHLLIEAWGSVRAKFPDAQLVLVGPRHDVGNDAHSEYGRRISSLVQSTGAPESVHFTGILEDLPAVYAAADVTVLATSREGGTPNVVLESMSCERPVVVTPFDGQSQALGRPGLEFSEAKREPAAIAEAILEILSNDQARAGFVERGRRWVEQNMRVEASLDRFAEFYRAAQEGTLDQMADRVRLLTD